MNIEVSLRNDDGAAAASASSPISRRSLRCHCSDVVVVTRIAVAAMGAQQRAAAMAEALCFSNIQNRANEGKTHDHAGRLTLDQRQHRPDEQERSLLARSRLARRVDVRHSHLRQRRIRLDNNKRYIDTRGGRRRSARESKMKNRQYHTRSSCRSTYVMAMAAYVCRSGLTGVPSRRGLHTHVPNDMIVGSACLQSHQPTSADSRMLHRVQSVIERTVTSGEPPAHHERGC